MSNNITQLGYKIEDFKNGKKTYFDLIYFEDVQKIQEKIAFHFNLNDLYFTAEYRILTANKEIKWIEARMYFNKISDRHTELQGINFDITERKIAEEKLKVSEQLQKKEIHHRIKNNLQVISTLLYLESSKFEDINVKNAFENSQNRIKSMALIHEELYRSNEVDSQKINFKNYILKLTEYLFQSYKTTTKNIVLKFDVEELYLSIDIAIPLGTIINELITNSLKYAFIKKDSGLISIKLENIKENKKILYISDNGISIKEVPNLDTISSLGLQLVHALVTQIDGSIQINIINGLEYKIEFEVK